MFNYYYTMTPHILCSNSPQIHLNNHAMCRFQFLLYGMHRFQQTMSTRFTLNVEISTPGMCRFQQTMSRKHSMFITTHSMSLYNLWQSPLKLHVNSVYTTREGHIFFIIITEMFLIPRYNHFSVYRIKIH